MRILVADDSPSFRAALTRTLVEAGFEVVRARDGIEALSVFYSEQPDLVLLDLIMPRLTGWVVCRIIKEDPTFGRTPVLAITNSGDSEDRYWAERSGADAFIRKSEVGDSLLDRVRAVVASRALADLAGDGGSPMAPAAREVDVLTRVCTLLDRKLFEATIVNDITSIAALTLDLQQSLQRTLETLHHLVDFDAAAIGLVEEKVMATWTPRPVDRGLLEEFRDRVVAHLDEVDSTSAGAAAFSLWDGVGEGDPVRGSTWRSEYRSRLQSHGRVVGSLVLASTRVADFDDRAHHTLRSVAPAVVTVVDSARMYHRSLGMSARSAS